MDELVLRGSQDHTAGRTANATKTLESMLKEF